MLRRTAALWRGHPNGEIGSPLARETSTRRRNHPMKSFQLGCVVLLAAALGGCGADATSSAPEGKQNAALSSYRQPLPTTSGTFQGHYVVPTPPNLAAAARYPVDEVEWGVEGGIATLRYYLPIG